MPAVAGFTKEPRLRFPGFTDPWEQRKLGEIIEDYVEKTTIENQYPVLTSSQQKGIVLQDEYFSDGRAAQTSNIGYYIIPRGHFAYRSRSDNDVYVFNRNDCIDVGIISYFYPVFKAKNVDSDFLLKRLNNGLEKQIRIASEGTGQHVLSLSKFKEIIAPIPNIEEQQAIGTFFRHLDHLITLHQRKLDALKEYKKGMLQKMFPKDGETVPEIRFPGFTDPWEQRKLGECFDERDSRSSEGELISVTIGEGIKKFSELGRHDNSSEDKSHYKRVEVGDIAYNSMRMWQGASGYSPYSGILSPAYTVLIPKDNISSLFFSYMFKRPAMIHTFQINSQGITSDTWNLKFPALSEIETTLPEIEEQRKIAEFLTHLDQLITLHQRKLDTLKEMKKGYLQQMFC